ncbi:hypothetical protein GCM10009839_45290 [Catenulispora yoronensis]|uniref:Chitin-binding type-3 domain-containing protein n=1 Tax=Catenulispora yoronensis TaxID=450799 RepID=A0ABP5G1M4_9ACTN
MIRRALATGLAVTVISAMSVVLALPAAQASQTGTATPTVPQGPATPDSRAQAVDDGKVRLPKTPGRVFSASTDAVNVLATPPNIDVNNVKAHLSQFQTFANSNGGNRATGTGGHTQTAQYLKSKLEAAGFTVTMQSCTRCNGSAQNVIADWPGGDTNNTYMFGAHADSVSAGPGINDDGSGIASILEVALQLAAAHPTMQNHVRFGFWTGEEQGEVGSAFYVSSLSSAQRAAIKGYGTFDMVASPNAGYFINGSETIATNLRAYFTSIGVSTETSTECCSDDGSFRDAGIPAALGSTGASAVKTSAQAGKWGGSAGAAYDSCYHRSCDSYPSNINSTSLDRFADSIAYAVWGVAVGSSTPTNDFSIGVSPASGSVAQGGTVSTTVSTAVTQGSAQQVTLAVSGLPGGVTASFNPATVTAGQSSTLTLTASATATTGSKAITVTGTAPSGAHTATYTATVTSTSPGNDFSVSVSPGSASVPAGSSTTATVSTATVSGTAQTVALSVSGSPTGVTASVSPSSVTSGGSATLSIAVAATAAAGTYTLTVTGSGSATHSASFTLTVTGGGGGGNCAGVSAWSASTSYAPGDKVTYNGHLYKSTWYSTGAVPTDPQSWAVWSDGGAC